MKKKIILLPRSKNQMIQRFTHYLMPMMLPILLAIIPSLYHYSNNVENLTLANLSGVLVFNAVLAVIVFLFLLLFNRAHPIRAALVASVFLIFFNVYGLVFRYLVNLDVIRMKHYTLLPLMLILTVYASLLISKIKDSKLFSAWKGLFLILGILALLNLSFIVPTEVKRWRSELATASREAKAASLPVETSPDIYYIIFDEFAGLQAMREYWHYDGVDDFAAFLKGRGFMVAEESYGNSIDTLHQMATRLNYQEYPEGEKYKQTYFQDRADNQVMRYLKSRGYTTVVFDEIQAGYPSAPSINADYVYQYNTPSIPQSGRGGYKLYFDEFGELVMDNTMLYTISERYKKNSPASNLHISMISFTVEHLADKDIHAPKFVYVHLMQPHAPFIFDRNGGITQNDRFTNWNYYLDNYIYTINIAERIVDNILAQADPENPPVIILQSDHGARNRVGHGDDEESVGLQNYPEKYKSLILNALLLPGYDPSKFPQDIDPINTFPLIFNYLFDDKIPLK